MNMSCPNCDQLFAPNTSNDAINNHIDLCLSNHSNPSFSKILYNTDNKAEFYYVWSKFPGENGKTVWKQEKRQFFSNEKINEIVNLSPEAIKSKGFEEKQIWFKFQLETLRIPWTQGADPIMITKENVINDTLNFINLCDMHKEIKIYIENDKVNDAGGLFREWIFLLSKELFKSETELFKRVEVEEFSFKINPKGKNDPQTQILYNLVGKILGKSLFERIPLSIYIDRTMMKHILGKNVVLEDLQYFDSQLFKSLKFMKENDIEKTELLEEFFVVNNYANNEVVELKTNGKDIKVNNSNKEEYIDSLINYVTFQSIQGKIEPLLDGFFEVIPEELISIFTIEEFEIMMNGLPFIDVNDWRENTEYAGFYNKDHEKIHWFWKIVSEFNQFQLSKLLQYCTGSSRISIEGFRNLESNRGKFCKFCIESVEFNKANVYPKAFTCFNRLNLPAYEKLEVMRQYLFEIVSNEFEGVFGLE